MCVFSPDYLDIQKIYHLGRLFPTGHSWMWRPPIHSAQLLLRQMEVSLSNIPSLLIQKLVVDTPELTASSTIPTSTISGSATNTTTTSTAPPSSSSGSSSSHKSDTGAIAGGAVGGVVGLTLIAGAVVFFMRRRQAETALSSAHGSYGQGPPSEAPLNSPPLMQQFSQPPNDQTSYNGSNQYVSNHPRPLYNPDDRSTWPQGTRVDITDIHTTASGPGQLPYGASQPGHYNPVPEL